MNIQDLENIKLLIVDDHPESLLSLEKILRRLPVEIYTARSGTEALSLMLKHQFSLVIIDVQMPGMSGFEVASLMQSNYETKGIPIIFVTAFDKDEKYIFKGFQAGAVDYLFKPIKSEILAGKVRVFLNLKHKQEELLKALNDLQKLSMNNKLVLDSIEEGILGMDSQGLVSFSNPAAAEMLKYSVEEIAGMHISIFLENADSSYKSNDEEYQEQEQEQEQELSLEDVLTSSDIVREGTLRCKDGSQFPAEYSYSKIKDATHNIQGNVIVFQDITHRKDVERRLIRLANFDPLTGVANRVQFHHFLQSVLVRSKRHSRKFAILFLDLDNFKDINDTKGHDVGDSILHTIANRLTDSVRSGDLVARMGGDEFAIVLDDISYQDLASTVAEKIIETNNNPIFVNDSEYAITSSIGIATYPDAGDCVEDLVKAADTAMYEAKNYGKNQYRFFKQEMQEKVVLRTKLKNDLINAINNQEFDVYYQPQFSRATNELIGVEALIRWIQPSRGMVPPDEFIPLSEELGLIVPIGDQVFSIIFNQFKNWTARNLIDERFKLAINLSARQLKEDNLVSTVEKHLVASSLNPKQIELELTETMVMADTAQTMQLFDQLHQRGIKIAIDDFGTGYSSLSYLSKLTIATLKIDRLFVSNIGKSFNDEAIVKATINLAHSLNMKVTAEGVETEEQKQFLINHNCDYLQGFYYAKPLKSDEFEATFFNFDNKVAYIKSNEN